MEKLIGAEIKSLQNIITRKLDSIGNTIIGDFQLSGPNMFILKLLKEFSDKDVFQCDLEKILHITKSTCSKVLSTMESKGLIMRVGVLDARYKKISLTPLGEEVVAKSDFFINGFEKKLKNGLTEEQLETFFYCMDVMKKNAEKED